MSARMRTAVAAAAVLGLAAPGAAHAAPDLQLTDVVPGHTFVQPVYVTSPPGDPDRVLVVEQGGKVQMVKGGVVSTFLDLTSRVNYSGEDGLLSIAFAPDYASSGLFYAFYSDATSCGSGTTNCDDRVDEFHATSLDAADAPTSHDRKVIAIPHQATNNHHGGALQFGPDGLLYISTGDARLDANGEDTTVLNGKMLRIDPRLANGSPYTVPSDNPFAGDATDRRAVWAWGLRNPWRFSFDAPTGDLVLPDVGESTREEINLVRGGDATGKDFEWASCEGDIAYPLTSPLGPCPLSGAAYVSPVLTYAHATGPGDVCGGAVIGGSVVRDLRLPNYTWRYIFGDYCHQSVWTADLNAGSLSTVNATIVDTGLTVGTGVQSIGADADCRIYVTHQSGWVRRVDPAPGTPTGPPGCDLRPPQPSRPPPAPPGGGSGGSPAAAIAATIVPGADAAVDRTPPAITRVGMSRDRFAVGRGSTAASAVVRGTAFRFTLSKAGVVSIRLQHVLRGRRVGRRCLAATRARGRRPACGRLTGAGTLTRRLAAGRQSVPFTGRIRARPLAPGRYQVALTERDAAGNVSRSQTLGFTIVAG